MVYDFDGNGLTDVLISSINFEHTPPVRWLSLYYQKKRKGFVEDPDVTWAVDRRASVIVLGDFLPRPGIEICFLAPTGLYYHLFQDNAPRPTIKKLLHTKTFFTSPSNDSELHLWMSPIDLDNNGYDDVVIPLSDGYKVYLQIRPGIFGKVSHLKLAASRYVEKSLMEAVSLKVTQELPKVLVADINGDGRKDLVSIQKNFLYYFFQDKGARFSPRPMRVFVGALTERMEKDLINVSLITLKDINGDRITDLAITKISGTIGLIRGIETKVYIFLGRGRGRFLSPDALIKDEGVSIDPEFIDLNLDGACELVMSSVDTSVLYKIIDISLLRAISIEYRIYKFDRRINNYPRGGPSYTRPMLISIRDIERAGIASVPLLYFRGDHDGDGRPDMVILEADGHLQIRRGRGGKHIDFMKDAYFKIKLGRRPYSLNMFDLNGDKRCDILLMHRGALGILLSR